MEKQFSDQSYMAKFAKILMEEGDIETATALKTQITSVQPRAMTEDEFESYSLNKSNAKKALSYNDYVRAVEFQSNAVQISQKTFGVENIQTLEDIVLLGECFHKNGDFDQALEKFYLARRIASYKLETSHDFTHNVVQKIKDCEASIKRTQGLDHLAQHLDAFFQTDAQDTPAAKAHRLNRLEAIGQKLAARNQISRATAVYKTWISECVEDAPVNDENTIQCIFRYADFYAQTSNLAKACEIYRDLVGLRNRQNHMGGMQTELKIALEKWAHCLRLRGQTQSAVAIDKLAHVTGKQAPSI